MDINMGAFWTVAVIALLFGGLGGSILFPTEKTITVTEIKEVPYEVEKIVEVEIPCELSDTEPLGQSLLDQALATFLIAAEDEEDEAGNDVKVLECDGDEFDFDEISVSRVYDSYSVNYDDDVTEVSFDVKLKYKESDLRSCREKYNVVVIYEADEDSEVEAVIA